MAQENLALLARNTETTAADRHSRLRAKKFTALHQRASRRLCMSRSCQSVRESALATPQNDLPRRCWPTASTMNASTSHALRAILSSASPLQTPRKRPSKISYAKSARRPNASSSVTPSSRQRTCGSRARLRPRPRRKLQLRLQLRRRTIPPTQRWMRKRSPTVLSPSLAR